MSKRIVIIGASGHGKVVADIARKNGYTDILFLDDRSPELRFCVEYPVVGTINDASKYIDSDFFVAIGNSEIRRKIQTCLIKNKNKIVKLIHPNAVIGESVEIGVGTVVMAGVVINSCTKIGRGCIINTCSSIDHDCVIGDYAHISVGAHLSGSVKIGNNTWIGTGTIVSNNVEIVGDCIIGAGTVVIKDLKEPDTYIGVPARKMFKSIDPLL